MDVPLRPAESADVDTFFDQQQHPEDAASQRLLERCAFRVVETPRIESVKYVVLALVSPARRPMSS